MWERGATRGLHGVQGQSPSTGSGGQSAPEAEAYLLMNALILMFWRNKTRLTIQRQSAATSNLLATTEKYVANQ